MLLVEVKVMQTKYPCKYDGCDNQMMVMGYCDTHWQKVKTTWTPAEMEHYD